MSVFPSGQFHQMRPNWSVLHDVGVQLFRPGDSEEMHFHDESRYMFVLEGSGEIILGGERIPIEAGETILIEPQREHAIASVSEPLVVFWVSDDPQVPFRQGDLIPGQHERHPVLPPRRQPPPRARRVHSVAFDPDATFDPGVLTSERGDIVIYTNPARVLPAQAREIRDQCRRNGQVVAALSVDVSPDRIDTWLTDRNLVSNLETLAPHCIALRMELTDPAALDVIERLRAHWLDEFRWSNCRICFEFDQRLWSEADRVAILRTLCQMPPAEWGLVLHTRPELIAEQPFLARAMLSALLPWVGVLLAPRQSVAQTAHYVEAIGFQGWTGSEASD